MHALTTTTTSPLHTTSSSFIYLSSLTQPSTHFHMQTYKQMCMHAHTCIQPCMHARPPPHTHQHTHTHTYHAHTQRHSLTLTQLKLRTYTRLTTHPCIHTHIHAYTHARTHTHTPQQVQSLLASGIKPDAERDNVSVFWCRLD